MTGGTVWLLTAGLDRSRCNWIGLAVTGLVLLFGIKSCELAVGCCETTLVEVRGIHSCSYLHHNRWCG